MSGRSTLPASCLLMLAVAAAGCRSTGGPTPTFARGEASQQMLSTAEAPQVEVGTAATGVSNAAPPAVHATTRAPTDVRESPLSRLIGRFGRPKAIPLPRTDLEQPPVEAESAPAGDLASAF